MYPPHLFCTGELKIISLASLFCIRILSDWDLMRKWRVSTYLFTTTCDRVDMSGHMRSIYDCFCVRLLYLKFESNFSRSLAWCHGLRSAFIHWDKIHVMHLLLANEAGCLQLLQDFLLHKSYQNGYCQHSVIYHTKRVGKWNKYTLQTRYIQRYFLDLILFLKYFGFSSFDRKFTQLRQYRLKAIKSAFIQLFKDFCSITY